MSPKSQSNNSSFQIRPEETTYKSSMKIRLAAVLIPLTTVSLFASSYYSNKLDDPKGVYLTRENSSVRGDGIADDTDALQQAINKVQDTTNQGILFIPSGRY